MLIRVCDYIYLIMPEFPNENEYGWDSLSSAFYNLAKNILIFHVATPCQELKLMN